MCHVFSCFHYVKILTLPRQKKNVFFLKKKIKKKTKQVFFLPMEKLKKKSGKMKEKKDRKKLEKNYKLFIFTN